MLKSAAVVAAFWWFTVSRWGWMLLRPTPPPNTSNTANTIISHGLKAFTQTDWPSAQHALSVSFTLALLMWAFAIDRALRKRQMLFLGLLPQEKNGLRSSLGATSNFLEEDGLFTVEKKNQKTFPRPFINCDHSLEILQWIEEIKTNYPLHGQAVTDCLWILSQEPQFPAYSKKTHITLLEHSIRVAQYAKDILLTFHYIGIQDGLLSIPPTDPQYQPSGLEPMALLVSLCHDIGKLKTYMCDENHRVITTKGDHGRVGARYMAKLDSIQQLTIQDQSALYFALSFFHRPAICTLNANAQIEDDRSAALMMLLIEAHNQAQDLER